MKGQFAGRMANVQKSFIREILKVAQDPNVISFAGGLPSPDYFPVEPLRLAADKVLAQDGANALQYAPTLGYLPLREFIAQRYAAKLQSGRRSRAYPHHQRLTAGTGSRRQNSG